jgi:hypothetical protein
VPERHLRVQVPPDEQPAAFISHVPFLLGEIPMREAFVAVLAGAGDTISRLNESRP